MFVLLILYGALYEQVLKSEENNLEKVFQMFFIVFWSSKGPYRPGTPKGKKDLDFL